MMLTKKIIRRKNTNKHQCIKTLMFIQPLKFNIPPFSLPLKSYRDSSVVSLPLSDNELVISSTNLIAFRPNWGGLRRGTALNKPLTTNILSFREVKPRRISKTISESYLLGFIKLTGKMLKQVQHDFLFMEGLLCYP